MSKAFWAGVGTAVVAGLVVGYLSVILGLMPANADSKPGKLETWMAHHSLRATLRREAPPGDNPLPADAADLKAGLRLYSLNCAVCHGASDARASHIAMGLYQHAPQLAQHGVEDDPDGVIYWKIAHGIRLTGMPSFDGALTEKQLWQLTLFLKHMDALPPAVQKSWKALPSAAVKD
ncbi:MAG TPA: c-type cytochrome [bacterium]|nr:c-type cytochrome [bacterium]